MKIEMENALKKFQTAFNNLIKELAWDVNKTTPKLMDYVQGKSILKSQNTVQIQINMDVSLAGMDTT